MIHLLYVISPLLNVVATALLILALWGEQWEYVEFDMVSVQRLLLPSGFVTIFNETEDVFSINTLLDSPSLWESANLTMLPRRRSAGLWLMCRTTSLRLLPGSAQDGVSDIPECISYQSIDDKMHQEVVIKKPYRIMMQLTKSAQTCAIVSLLVVVIGLCLGFLSVTRQQVVLGMITSVCVISCAVYASFTVSLIFIRNKHLDASMITETDDDMDEDNKNNISMLLSSKVSWLGWSVYVTAASIVTSVVAACVWAMAMCCMIRNLSNSVPIYKQICVE